MSEATCAELARRYGVSRSTVTRALARARDRDDVPDPPLPTNPGEPQPRYRVVEMDEWWPSRPQPGRPEQKMAGGNTGD